MPKYPYLTRAGERGTWRYRRSVPAKLRPVIGAREILRSFRTTVLAEALAHYAEVAGDAERQLELARTEVMSGARPAGVHHSAGGPQRDVDVQQECAAHYRTCLERERAFRDETTRRVLNDRAAFMRGEIIPLPVSADQFYALPQYAFMDDSEGAFKVLLAMAYRQRLERRAMVLRTVMLTQDVGGLSQALKASSDVQLCPACAQQTGFDLAGAELELIDQLLGDEAAVLPFPRRQGRSTSSAAVEEKAPPGGPNLKQVVGQWIDAHSIGASAWSDERRRLCQRVMDDFILVCGDKAVGDYKKSDGREYVGLLRRLPANLDKMKVQLGIERHDLRRAAEIAGSKGFAPQDDNNINKKIGIVHQCFRWIMTRYDECTASPIDGMKIAGTRNRKEEKDPFTIPELNTMFAAPVFVGCESERHWNRPGNLVLRQSEKFWVPLIAVFSGMRSGEICQLTRDHVRQHAGVPYFALTKGLRLKNDASVRSVPVHQTLIDCGFLEFVDGCEGVLFPDLSQHVSGRWSDAWGKHFARFLRALKIKADGKDFHSTRHTFIAAAEASGMEFSVRERLVGHALQGQAGRYGRSYRQEGEDMQLLLARNGELQKLRFPGLKLDHLYTSNARTSSR